MSVRERLASVAGALLILIAVDAALARFDVFALLPATPPTSFFSSINYQISQALHELHDGPVTPRSTVFVGNSQLDALIHPFGEFGEHLVAAGAPPGTKVVSLCVWGTALTDAEVLTRDLAPMHPGLVVIGFGVPDVGTTLERAREMPVTSTLDAGWRNGMVPAADLEGRLDRWARTVWRLYRFRRLLRDLVLPADGWRRGVAPLPAPKTPEELMERTYGPERARKLAELRPGFVRGERYEDALPYLLELKGREYVDGLRERWRTLVPDQLQLEALRRTAAHVRDAGGRPAWVLLPENPVLELDPEIGAEVRRRSDEVARTVQAVADEVHVPLLDLRRLLPPAGFSDLNHAMVRGAADFMKPIAAQLAAAGVLGG